MWMIWSLITVLMIAVVVMFWMLMQNQRSSIDEIELEAQLQRKVEELESNLQKTLEIMQDLAKKMHTQQEGIDHLSTRMKLNEERHAELVQLFAQHLKNQSNA